jgi:hypothetical protein
MQLMARTSALRCLSVLTLVIASSAFAAEPTSSDVAVTLAIQDAMRQARESLQHGQSRGAIDILEAQLPRINGNSAYLALLREAYAGYVKELQLAHREDESSVYLKRLQILDRSATDNPLPNPKRPSAATPVIHAGPADDDPLQQVPRREAPGGPSLLPDAEKAFAEKRYAEADTLFARVYASSTADAQHAQQWAYCKLSTVVTRLKEAEAGGTPIPAAELEHESKAALQLAGDDPKLSGFGRQVLETVRQRAATAPATVNVRHEARSTDGWARAESANFRLLHNQPRELAEQIVRAAEQARSAAFEKWSSGSRADWKPVCEIYLYATAAEYAKATGKPADSPGHATYKAKDGAVVGRRLDLRADDPNLVTSVVPHETTHLVLGDLFADAPLPRWADEGMAVLAEPRARFDRFVRTLHSNRRQGRLVPLDRLFAKDDYPDAALITVFYVQSVSVVDFLVAEKGPQAFVQFLRDVAKSGLEAALQKHYDCRNIAMLEERWRVKMFSPPAASAGGQGGQ